MGSNMRLRYIQLRDIHDRDISGSTLYRDFVYKDNSVIIRSFYFYDGNGCTCKTPSLKF